jgi:RimJ/RimL family protein N-acetyltransferase
MCISIAREKKSGFLWGDIMAENERMIGLCKELGFKIEWDYKEGTARALMNFG